MLARLILAAGLLGGIGVGGWQIWKWLQSDVWTDVTVISVLRWLDVPWALSPTDWVDFHEGLKRIPLVIVLPGLGVVCAGCLFEVADRLENRRGRYRWNHFGQKETAMAKVVGALCVLVLIAAFLGGVVVGGWQGFVWLRSGVFPDISVLTALHWFGMDWATNPTGWRGVHKALSSIPLAAGLFTIGGMAALAAGRQWDKSH
jgi:hypothetical protein